MNTGKLYYCLWEDLYKNNLMFLSNNSKTKDRKPIGSGDSDSDSDSDRGGSGSGSGKNYKEAISFSPTTNLIAATVAERSVTLNFINTSSGRGSSNSSSITAYNSNIEYYYYYYSCIGGNCTNNNTFLSQRLE